MPVYNGNRKAKDLYYGGAKIKEAYYNGNKVYSSGPLYYCYTNSGVYSYYNSLVTTTGSHTFWRTNNGTKATNSSQLNYTNTISVSSVVANGFYSSGYLFTRSQENDLYI